MHRLIHRLLISLHIVWMVCVGTIPAFCQTNYIIHHYTNENGLPANGIKGIELDKKTGFLWIGTQAGIVRFDGKNFTDFSSIKNPLVASRITFIARNREGTIYSEDDNFSVYRITHSKPEFVGPDTLLMDPVLLRIDSSPVIMSERLKHHQRFSFLPNTVLFDDDIGDSSSFTFLYFGHPSHYNATKDTLLYFKDQFQQLFKLNGTVYFTRESLDVWKYDDEQMKLIPVPVKGMPGWNKAGNGKPRFVWKPGMSEPLLIYKGNIWKLQQLDSALYLQPWCQECCPSDPHILDAQIWEEHGIIFLASEKNGLYVIRNSFLRTVRTDTIVEAGRAEYAQAEITPGMITTGYGLTFSTQGKLSYRKDGMQFHPWVIYRDRHGDHWFHSKDTIIHLHKKDNSYTRMPIGSGTDKMIFAEMQNRLYVITELVIAEITNDQYRQLYLLPYRPNVRKNALNPDAAIEWEPGVLAIAAENLILFNTEKRAPPDTIPIPGLTAKVRTLLKYKDYLLIGTYGQGFYMFKNGVVKKMPLDKNGYLNYAHCFVPDDKGFCWISSNHGLFKVSMNALVAAYENDLSEIYYHYFGKNDGIFNTEFNGGCQPCALVLSNGLYSFPTMNGVMLFDPQQQHTPPPSGNIFIEEVLADSVFHNPDHSSFQALPYGLKNLRFRLALPQFGNHENIYFSYKLEPYNDEWETQDIIQNNVLQFGGLKPGDYKLYLRVRNGFEPEQFGTTVFEFRILKPWHQAWWFYLLCITALVAIMWAIIKWRTASIAKRKEELQQLVKEQTQNIETQSRQLESQLDQLQTQQVKLEEDNTIKARLIAIISHDMISPLKFMSLMSKKLKNGIPSSDPNYRVAEAMVSITQELEDLSGNMLNWIRFHYASHRMKPERFDLHQQVNESVEIASTLAAEKGVRLYNDIPPATYVHQYPQAIGVIVYNLAFNAMKNTATGEIRISSVPGDHYFSLIIADTGSGMAPELVEQLNAEGPFEPAYSGKETKKFQFGFRIIKDLLQMIHGKMNIESMLQKGTKVTIEFPLSKN